MYVIVKESVNYCGNFAMEITFVKIFPFFRGK